MAIVLNGTTGITTPDIDSTAGFDAADITGTISTAQIADANVTTAKIADANVTTAKIADVNVTQGKLADQAVNEAKMQVSNAPTNGYMLTAESGNTGGLTWAAAPTSSTTAAAVGTYAMAGGLSFASQFSTTVAGSDIRPRSPGDHGTYGYLTGTWRNMGYHQYETNWNVGNTSIWVRIS